MMGTYDPQEDLFSYHINLDERVRSEHPLRKINENIDFKFVRKEVSHLYGHNGNESVDPEIIMKMMFLLFYDNVESERELMKIIQERLDYMWFLGYGLNDTIPNHSVLSKARKRWGAEVFEVFFIRIIEQCVQENLVDGKKIYMDGSLVDANASTNSIKKGCPELISSLKEIYRKEEYKLDEAEESSKRYSNYRRVNERLISKTDPDAPVVRKGKGESRPRYKVHRVVDDKCGVITASETTPGDVEENSMMMKLVEEHEKNTRKEVETVVADKQYGTIDNFRKSHERGIKSHMGDLKASQKDKGNLAEIFPEEDFVYDSQTDTYRCPAGQVLTRRKYHRDKKAHGYACRIKTCRACPLKTRCTKSKTFRTLLRHENHEAVQAARLESQSLSAKRDRNKRKWLMEGSFADAENNHGFKRSRWRRLINQRIQNHLIAAVQNIRKLIKHMKNNPEVAMELATSIKNGIKKHMLSFFEVIFGKIRPVYLHFQKHQIKMF